MHGPLSTCPLIIFCHYLSEYFLCFGLALWETVTIVSREIDAGAQPDIVISEVVLKLLLGNPQRYDMVTE